MADAPTDRSSTVLSHPRTLEAIRDAVRFWEPRRLTLNALLAGVMGAYLVVYWLRGKIELTAELAFTVLEFAIVVNIAYCIAYLVDAVFVRIGHHIVWKRWRNVAFCAYLLVTVVLASRALEVIADSAL